MQIIQVVLQQAQADPLDPLDQEDLQTRVGHRNPQNDSTYRPDFRRTETFTEGDDRSHVVGLPA